MNAELKAKWVAALRSGDYKQRQGYFERDGRFCCLGVLCEVMGVPTLGPEGIGNWDAVEAHVGNGLTGMLVLRNDVERNSFAEIADWIDAFIPTEAV